MLHKQLHLSRGQRVFEQGDVGDCAYLIESGSVEILHREEGGAEHCVAVLGVHELFGELALLGEQRRAASARAASDTCLTVLPAGFFEDCLNSAEPLTRYLLRTVTARLQRQMDLQVSESPSAERDQDRAVTQIQLTRQLAVALQRTDEITSALQPIVDLNSGRIIGFEALARWHSAELGRVTPAQFIPVAEQSGLIAELGRYMLRQALAQLAQLPGREQLFISINVSVRQFDDPLLFEQIAESLQAHGLAPRQIKLEITESLLMHDQQQTQRFFASCAALGVPVAIDDFGTGYSALAQLHRLKVDTVKLDRSFVADLRSDARLEIVVGAVSALCAQLGVATVVEGVETVEQTDACRVLGIGSAQGFLYSPAVSSQQAAELLRTYNGV